MRRTGQQFSSVGHEVDSICGPYADSEVVVQAELMFNNGVFQNEAKQLFSCRLNISPQATFSGYSRYPNQAHGDVELGFAEGTQTGKSTRSAYVWEATEFVAVPS